MEDMEQINDSLAPTAPPPPPFTASPAALARIAHLLTDEPAGSRFWVSVLGGGCSGFQYNLELSTRAPQADDLVIEGIIAVDSIALDMLKGSVLDYVEDLASAGFEIKNPNATARCGCGNSFSVAL